MEKTKESVRAEMRRLCRAVPEQERIRCAEEACACFVHSELYRQADGILCYMAMPEELSVAGIMERAMADGKVVAVPRCVAEARRLDFYTVRPWKTEAERTAQFRRGSWGIWEPIPDEATRFVCGTCGVRRLCVLVPGLAFSAAGLRLGHGKGYYDGFLAWLCAQAEAASCTVLRVGVGFGLQRVEKLPHEVHDVAMQWLLSERGLERCQR